MIKPIKMSGIGLDTTCLNYTPKFVRESSNPFNFIYTNPSANNGDLVGRLNKDTKGELPKLIIGLDFLDEATEVITEHLRELKRSSASLLLIDASCEWVEYADKIQELLDYELVEEIGIKNPEKLSIEQLEGLRLRFGFRYVGLDICPLYYNTEIMGWIAANQLYTLGFNQLGGYLSSPVTIECLTLPYLLNFAAFHCNFVFLSGRDITFSEVNKEYLEELIGATLEENEYLVKKTVNKLIKPLRRIANISLKIEDERFPINEQDELFNRSEFVIDLGNSKEVINLDTEIEDDVATDKVNRFLEDARIPKDAKTPKDVMAYIRPKAYSLFKSAFDETNGWKTVCSFLGDIYVFSALRVTTKRSYLIFKKETLEVNTYFLYYSKDTGFVLRKIKKNDQNA